MSQVPEVTPQHRSQEMMPSLACATVPQVAIPGVATRRGKLFRYTPIVERGASKMLTILDAICAGDMRSIQSKQKLIADLEACGYLERRAANEVDEESRGLSLLARRLDQQIRSSTQWQKGARQEAQRLKRWGKSKLSAIINVCTFGRYGEEQQRRVETLAEEMRRQQKIASSASKRKREVERLRTKLDQHVETSNGCFRVTEACRLDTSHLQRYILANENKSFGDFLVYLAEQRAGLNSQYQSLFDCVALYQHTGCTDETLARYCAMQLVFDGADVGDRFPRMTAALRHLERSYHAKSAKRFVIATQLACKEGDINQILDNFDNDFQFARSKLHKNDFTAWREVVQFMDVPYRGEFGWLGAWWQRRKRLARVMGIFERLEQKYKFFERDILGYMALELAKRPGSVRSIVSNQVAWGKALLARGLVTSPALALCALELGKKGRVDHKRVDLVKQLSDGMRGGTTKYVIAALLESMRGDSQVEMLFVKELAAMARKAGIKRTGLPATALVMSRADSSSSVLARQGGSTCDGHTDSVSCPGRYAVLLDPTYADRAKARLAQRLVQQDRQTLLDDENNFVEEDWC